MKGGGGRQSYRKYTEPVTEGGKRYGAKAIVDDCDISFNTTLQKIVLAGLGKVTIGDHLSIELGFFNTLEAKNADGNVCGNITSVYAKKLIECIGRGNTYQAKLLNNKGEVLVNREV